MAENPPKPRPSFESLNSGLNDALNGQTEGIEDVDFIYILYFVNCKGEGYDYQIAKHQNGTTARDTTSQMSIALREYLKSTLTYEPGFFMVKEGREEIPHYIDFQGAFMVKVEEGVLSVLDDKQNAKHFKKKAKRKK
ncbi:MAG: hypothetical protein WAR83_09295 [Flavobacteriales bacterium]